MTTRSSFRALRFAALGILSFLPAVATDFKPITLRPDYDHDRFVTQPRELVRQFEAFVTSFDTKQDDGVAFGIPDFVAYEMQRLKQPLAKGPKRPSPWISDPALVAQGLAPTDASYHHSAVFLLTHPNWYVRGHLCMKEHAWRLGANADWNTHTVLNAVPQRGSFNSGIWLSLENKTADWADKYGVVWIVTGPIIENKKPKAWLGEKTKKEMLIAIPDALFKIVVRMPSGSMKPEVLAFRFPQTHPKYNEAVYDLKFFLTTVDQIEKETGLDFLTILPDDLEAEIESKKATALWQ